MYNQKEKKNYSTFFTILILFATTKLIQTAQKRSDSDIQCITQNTYWDSIISKEDFIKDPSVCHNISYDCCYISIKYTYGIVPIDKSYCFTMAGKVESWIKKFTNLFTDELMWYANNTYNNFEVYKSIGNNLDYIYYANYTCTTPHPIEDYSNYDLMRCALLNADGSCKIFNDADNFDAFVENLYKNITISKCDKLDEDGNCINYANPDYKYENSSDLIPLLENLKISLKFDEEDTNNLNSKLYNTENKSQTDSKWEKSCEPIPLVTVTVKCPDGYSNSIYFKFNYYVFYLVLIFLI